VVRSSAGSSNLGETADISATAPVFWQSVLCDDMNTQMHPDEVQSSSWMPSFLVEGAVRRCVSAGRFSNRPAFALPIASTPDSPTGYLEILAETSSPYQQFGELKSPVDRDCNDTDRDHGSHLKSQSLHDGSILGGPPNNR
jgi:hypothetical protein